MRDTDVERARCGRVVSAMLACLIWIGGLTTAVAQEEPRFYYGPHMWDGGWAMFFGPLWALLFLAALVAVVVLLVRWLGGTTAGGGGAPPAVKTPLDILRERFARGEMDKVEFEERKRALEM